MTAPTDPATSESLSPEALHAIILTTPQTPDATLQALRNASRRGKLPGFVTPDPTKPSARPQAHQPGAITAACDIFGSPFDRRLHIDIDSTKANPDHAQLRFRSTLRKKLPIALIVALAFTLWPGVWLTDSLLVTYFNWYPRAAWVTPAWYIPLTLLAIPALLQSFKKSEAAAAIETRKLINKLARITQATA